MFLARRFHSSASAALELSQLAACLAASYIGGTANLFETAATLNMPSSTRELLRLVAVADIAAMTVYFSVLLRMADDKP